MKKIRILIVDDHVVLREGMRNLLEREKDMEVVGEANDGEENRTCPAMVSRRALRVCGRAQGARSDGFPRTSDQRYAACRHGAHHPAVALFNCTQAAPVSGDAHRLQQKGKAK